MIIALVHLLVLASVPLAGGRLGALADLPLRRSGLAVAAILVQIVVISLLPGGAHALHTTLHIASYLLLGAFALANRRMPRLLLAGLRRRPELRRHRRQQRCHAGRQGRDRLTRPHDRQARLRQLAGARAPEAAV